MRSLVLNEDGRRQASPLGSVDRCRAVDPRCGFCYVARHEDGVTRPEGLKAARQTFRLPTNCGLVKVLSAAFLHLGAAFI